MFSSFAEALGNFFGSFYYWFTVASLFASLFLILGIIYSVVQINRIRKKEKMFQSAAVLPVPTSASEAPELNPQWEHILSLSKSESEADWRLAIIEADIMLSDMMTRMQYKGETLGEKLKVVEKSDFNTIDNAWEAHKIRNQIAHSGSDFLLSKREVDRTIRLYESVFNEFHYI